MNFFYKDITITGLLVVMPENERDFVDDMKMADAIWSATIVDKK